MSITATNHFSSIATHVDDCLKIYDEVCTRMAQADHAIGDKLRPGTMDDTLGRFRLWAGNTRARRRGTASLDYKLREASHIRDRVLKLLQSLETVLVKALQIITGERVPWEDLSDSESDNSNDGSEQLEDEPTTELSQLASNMTEVIKCLMRLSMAISNPAPHNQFRESAHFDCEYFEQFDIEHVRAKFPLAGEYLVLRLGKAISRRRQYLRYREAYRKQLEKDLDDQTDPSTAIDGTVASSLPTIARACTFTGALDEDDYNDTQSQTSYASSNNDESKLRPPPLPKEGWDGEPFECPLCFRIISVRQTTSWYKHVYRDLQPYMCTTMECKIPDRIYESRHEWFTHEMQEHRNCWECIEGCNMTFHSQDAFRKHLGDAHECKADNNRMHDVMQSCERRISMDTIAKCPLCKIEQSSLIQLRKHLGKHHTELALLALSSRARVDDDGQDESDSASHTDLSITREVRSVSPAMDTCTKCSRRYSDSHEGGQNRLKSQWTCLATSPRIFVSSRMETYTICAFCQTKNPSEDHFFHSHRITECLERSEADRSYSRPDHLRRHVENFHKTSLLDMVRENWRKDRPDVNVNGSWICGSCAAELKKPIRIYDEREDGLQNNNEAKGNRESHKIQLRKEEKKSKEQDKLGYETLIERIRLKEEMKGLKKKEQIKDSKHEHTLLLGFEDKKTDSNQSTTSITPLPTYAKISKTHLDVATLDFYNLPYIYDADPNYVIVLREMSQREIDVLFENTRRLRASYGDRIFIEAGGRDRHGKEEFASAKQPSGLESKARSDVGSLDREESVTLRDMMSFK